MIKVLKYQWLTFIWLCVILVLCFGDVSKISNPSIFFQGFDKMVHLGFFFILTVFMLYGFILGRNHINLSLIDLMQIIFYTAFIGVAIEVIQLKFFSYRSAELWDFVCDMLGVGMAIFSYLMLIISNYYAKSN